MINYWNRSSHKDKDFNDLLFAEFECCCYYFNGGGVVYAFSVEPQLFI